MFWGILAIRGIASVIFLATFSPLYEMKIHFVT